MIGLIIAIILFNFIAFKINKRLTTNQIIHIWAFTIALHQLADLYIDTRYHGYWYFSKDIIEWNEIFTLIVLLPPVNMMFLNWYPFTRSFHKRIIYMLCWVIAILLYEIITLLPEPWGYFNYGWWNLWYSALVNPLLFFIVLKYYKWICKIEFSSK